MKILIVEDDADKLRKLIAHIIEKCKLNRDKDIVVATSGIDAKRELRNIVFDLMILDIVLPHRHEDEPSQNTSIEIVKEITERDRLLKPKHIVGLTAFDDIAKEVAPIFDQRLWALINYDSTSDDWLSSLERFIVYLQTAENQRDYETYRTDLCVITAIRAPEAEAIYRLPWGWGPLEPLDETCFCRSGTFMSGGDSYRATIATAPRMGMVATALLASKLIERFRPRFLAMAGICAGIKGKVNLGDIVLADPTWDYQSGKRSRVGSESKLALDSHQIPLAAHIKAYAEHLQADKQLWHDIRNGWPSPPDTELSFIIGPVSSGSAVVSDSEFVEEIKLQQRKLAAIEMETYGLYAAAHYANAPKPTVFSLKSVADFADTEKDDAFQTYAAYTSAKALMAFCERYMKQLSAVSG